MTILRALIAGSLIVGCLAGTVHAQHVKPTNSAARDEEAQKQKDADRVDQQYKSTLERTRKDAAAPAAKDPWQNLRGDDANTKR